MVTRLIVENFITALLVHFFLFLIGSILLLLPFVLYLFLQSKTYKKDIPLDFEEVEKPQE